MSYFEYQFYTEDFDQEMLDFIKEKYGTDAYDLEWSKSSERLYYGDGVNGFWTDSDDSCLEEFTELSKQEFKRNIGMEGGMSFTKADLVAGKHVVRVHKGLDNTPLYLVLDEVLVNSNGREGLYNYTDCLKNTNEDDFDIVEVFKIVKINSLDIDSMTLSSIWKRTEKSETQIQLEKLQQQIAELQSQANKLQQTL